MSCFVRWLRFNLVGAMGMAVQLSVLALLNSIMPLRYLLASALAVETAVLHNFFWHLRYTWRDRRFGACPGTQLWRFHLSNGFVSLAGNLALMRLLVHAAHLRVLLANSIAVVCCSALNFLLGNWWTFSGENECGNQIENRA